MEARRKSDGEQKRPGRIAWMGRIACIVALLSVAAAPARGADHPAQGLVLKVDAPHRTVLVSCDAIPGYMAAMEMPLRVRNAVALKTLQPGAIIRFVLVEQRKAIYAEKIEPVMNFEAEPAEAEALMGLRRATDPKLRAQMVETGQQVPDFTLTDQAGRRVSLSEFRGKVVALTFGYSRCPNPEYCYRLSNNLRQVARRFHARTGRDLVLITIAIDPEFDHGEALTQYANRYHANPQVWHFLTGSVPEIRQVAAMFGMDFWETGGLLTHTLHTVVIGRDGRLAANVEGNAFTAKQFGDLVASVMNHQGPLRSDGAP
jgi:protein SCO1